MKAVLFDLDGVITDTAKYHFEAWHEIAKSLDIEIDETFNEKLKGINREESLDKILLSANKVDSYTKEEKLKVCEKNNVKLGIASASKNAPRILESLGVKDEFDCIVNPSLLKRGKPYPDIFIEGSKMLNLKQYDCVGIEDSYSGIKAINAANMTSIGVGKKEVLGKCDHIVEDTSLLNYNTLLQAWSKKINLD